jgi:hypothetical protein
VHARAVIGVRRSEQALQVGLFVQQDECVSADECHRAEREDRGRLQCEGRTGQNAGSTDIHRVPHEPVRAGGNKRARRVEGRLRAAASCHEDRNAREPKRGTSDNKDDARGDEPRRQRPAKLVIVTPKRKRHPPEGEGEDAQVCNRTKRGPDLHGESPDIVLVDRRAELLAPLLQAATAGVENAHRQ